MKFLLLFCFTAYSLFAYEIGNGKALLLLLNSSKGTVSFNELNMTVLPHPLNAQKAQKYLLLLKH